MKKPPFSPLFSALLGGVLAVAGTPAAAQGPGGPPAPSGPVDPMVIAVAPDYEVLAPASSDVQITFRRAVVLANGSPLVVWGSQSGRRTGALTGSGTRQIRFNPAQDWRPGEEITIIYKTSPATLDQATPSEALSSLVAYRFRGASASAAGPLTAQASPPTTGLSARQVEVADLDGDGDTDLVVVGTTSLGDGEVRVMRQDVGGYSVLAALATTPTANIVLGDLDNDGLAELLVSDADPTAATVTVYHNPGTGAFSGSRTVAVGGGARSLRTMDINGDGFLDLLTANTDNTVSKRLNDGTGTLLLGTASLNNLTVNNAQAVLPYPVPYPVDNGQYESVLFATTTFIRLMNNNGGTYTSSTNVATGIGAVNDLAVGDFNSDGQADVLIATPTGLLLASHSAPGQPLSFPLTTLLSGASCPTAQPADVDGDGDLDILVPVAGANGLQILRNDGTGSFTAEAALPLNAANSQPAWVAAADLNGDGTLDAVTANGMLTNSATLLLNSPPNGPRSVVVSTPQVLAGTYIDVTVTGTGTLTLAADLVVTGTLTIQNGGKLRPMGYRLLGPGNVAVEAGATMEVYAATGLHATGTVGDLQNTGARQFSSGARYVYPGMEAQQTGAGLPATVLDLEVDNPAGVTLTSPTAVTHTVVLTDGDLTSNGKLTLLGSAAGTAMVINTNGAVLGNATMQRYVSGAANPGLGYRHLSSPVSATTFADLTTAGFTPVVNAAFNNAANPLSVRPYPTVFAYDESRLTGSGASADFGRGYLSPIALTAPMVPGKGYTAYLRPTAKPDFTGTLTTGNVNSGPLTCGSTPESGWQLMGNPYPSPLRWDVVAASLPAAMSRQVSVYRSTGPTSGTYVTRINGVSTPDPNGVLANGLIGAMEGFFVRVVSPGSTSFNFTNAARPTAYAAAPAYRSAALPQVHLSVTGAADPAQADYATVYCAPGATTALETGFDAWKQPSLGAPTLSTRATGSVDPLAINGIAPLTAADVVIPVGLDVPVAGTYHLAATTLDLPTGWHVVLEDALTGTTHELTAAAPYALTLPAGPLPAGRLQLRLTANTVVTGIAASAAATAAEMMLYPNPTRAAVRLTLPRVGAEATTITVLDARGVVVRTQPLPVGHTEATVAVDGLPEGVYVVRVGRLARRLVIQ